MTDLHQRPINILKTPRNLSGGLLSLLLAFGSLICRNLCLFQVRIPY